MIEAIHWDMDGTIVDTEPHNDIHLPMFVRSLGVEPPEDLCERFRGKDAKALYGFLLAEYKLGMDINTLIKDARLSYLTYLKSLPGLATTPGVKDLIHSIAREGIPQTIASSASRQRIHTILEIVDLADYFPAEKIVCGDDITNGKPFPDIYLEAAKRVGKDPKRSVGIEDSNTGIASVKNAGMWCVAFSGAHNSKQDLSEAHIIVTDFSQLSVSQLSELSVNGNLIKEC